MLSRVVGLRLVLSSKARVFGSVFDVRLAATKIARTRRSEGVTGRDGKLKLMEMVSMILTS